MAFCWIIQSSALSGTAAAFVAAAKFYAKKPSAETIEQMLLFAKPLSYSVSALVTFALQDEDLYG